MPPGSAKPALVLVAIFAVEVAVTALAVCRDQAWSAIQGLLLIGAIAFAIVWLGVLGHRFIATRLSEKPPETAPLAWRRPLLTALLAAVIAMGLIAALGVQVALTETRHCG